MSWFDPKELPIITNSVELEEAMGIVKSRFNGHPHKFTRNDYLLLINTLYAALQAACNSAGNTVSAELSQDLNPNYPLEVGYVKDTAYYSSGTKLEDIIKDILVGNPFTQRLQQPTILSSSGSNYFNPTTTITITTTESNCDIYYSLDSDHGWRIYNGQFDINQTTTVKAKVVPNYRSGYLWTESQEIVETFYYSISPKLQKPSVIVYPDYTKCEVVISSTLPNSSSYILEYSDDNQNTWNTYTNTLVYNTITNAPIIYTRLKSLDINYLDSDIEQGTVRYLQMPNPSVTFKDSDNYFESFNTNGVFSYYGSVILDSVSHDPSILHLQQLVLEWNGSTIQPTQFTGPVTLQSKTLMGDGKTFNISSGITIDFNRLYYTINIPSIVGTDQFTSMSSISVGKNQALQGRNSTVNGNDYVDLTWKVNGVVQTGLSLIITDTSVVTATVTVKSGYEPYYQGPNYSVSTTKTFTKKKPIIIYSSMIDPVGQTYNIQSGSDESGNPIINTISINYIGDSFDVNSFDSNVKFDVNNHKHLISSGYCVKSSKDMNPSIYTSEKLDLTKFTIQEKNPTSSNWNGDTYNTANLSTLLELQVGQQIINGNPYYKYSLKINLASTCLYKLQYGNN